MALILTYLLTFLHPIHISVTDVEYNEKNKSLQIINRIFIDDLEMALRADLKDDHLNLLEPGNGRSTKELVKDYLRSNLSFKINGKLVDFEYLGMEREGDSVVSYIEIEKVRRVHSVEVRNTTLIQLFETQSNLVHFNIGGTVKSVRLMRHQSTEVITFDQK